MISKPNKNPLRWRCCKCLKLGAYQPKGAEGDVRKMTCMTCGGVMSFTLTTALPPVAKRRSKPPRMMPSKETARRLSEKAVERGVAVPAGWYEHSTNKQVQTRISMLAGRFERVGTSGLREIGE